MSPRAAADHLFVTRPGSGALFDVTIALGAFAGTLLQLGHGGIPTANNGPGELDLASGLLAGCSTLPLVGWRRAPLTVFAVTALATVVLGGLGDSRAVPLGPTAALYLLAASRDEENPWVVRNTVLVAGLFCGYLAASTIPGDGFPGGALLHTGLAWSVAWFAGERTRLRHEHIAELAERARRTERDAERERLLAIAEERARIARDLHDSAGHAINFIAVRAGAARMRHADEPGRSLAALETIEKVARQTGDEIDQIVGTLRQGTPDTGVVEAPPGLASLETLITNHEAAGLSVTLVPAGAPRPLRAVVDQAAYRILQEALTNAARHGTGEVRVELAFGDAALSLNVTNPVGEPGAARANGGHGLIGMRERVSLLGGALEAREELGTFAVQASIPYGGGAGA